MTKCEESIFVNCSLTPCIEPKLHRHQVPQWHPDFVSRCHSAHRRQAWWNALKSSPNKSSQFLPPNPSNSCNVFNSSPGWHAQVKRFIQRSILEESGQLIWYGQLHVGQWLCDYFWWILQVQPQPPSALPCKGNSRRAPTSPENKHGMFSHWFECAMQTKTCTRQNWCLCVGQG